MSEICIVLEGIEKYATSIICLYSMHILLALVLSVLYYYAYIKYKKGTNIFAFCLLLSSMAFDSAWSMYFAGKFMFSAEPVNIAYMMVPQVVYIIVLVYLLWATLKKPKEISSGLS